MKKIFIINLGIVFFILISLELLANFLKLSDLRGIEKGLIDTNHAIHKTIPGSSGVQFGKRIFIDKYGFRSPRENYDYNNSNDSVFIIGDSVTFGNGVDEDKIFVGRLRKEFKNINFYNTAVPGYNLKHFKYNLKEIDNFKNINKIFYFITFNDVYGGKSIVQLNKNDSIKKNLLSLNIIPNKINAFLRNKSYLYMLILGIVTDPSKRYFQTILNFYQNQNLDAFKDYLLVLKNKALKNDIELKIIILPYEYQTRKCIEKNFIPQEKIANIISNLKIDFSDYTKEFCKIKKPKNLFLKFDPMHLSPQGHNLVFNLIRNKI